jgi:Spy/CpxP family protein refolding chaperone
MEIQNMRTLKTLKFAALAVALLFPASVLVAQPPDSPAGFGDGPGFGHGFPGRGFMLDRLAEELELSDGQKTEIEALRLSHREQLGPLMEQAREARHAVGALMRSEAFDEETIRSAARQAADIHVELTILRARHHSELKSVLTPEQQEKAAELRERWQESSEHSRGRPARGFGRGAGRGPRDAPGRW